MSIYLVFFLVALTAFGLLYFKWLTEHTDTLFWTCFLLYFDPGGFFAGLLDMGLLGRIKPYDLFFVLMMVAWRVSGYWKIETKFRIHRQYLAVFIVYSLYFTFVYGYFVPMHYGYNDFMLFLQKNRQFLYCPFIFLAVYQFGYMSINKLLKPLLYTASLMFLAFFFTVLTGIEIVPVYKFTRFVEEDRISLLSYGLSYYILPMGIISLFLKDRLPRHFQRVIILLTSLMFITIVLTLTRREFIRILFMLISIPLLTSYISGKSFGPGYRKLINFLLLPLLLLLVFFPVYIDFSADILENLFQFLDPDKSNNLTDYRVSGGGDLVFVKQIIIDHPLMGIGYYPAPWSEVIAMKESGSILGLALDASSEVQIYGSTMRLGFIGLILPIFIHVSIIIMALKAGRFFKQHFALIKNHIFELLLALTILYYFITLFTTELFSLFVEFYHPPKFANYSALLALFLAIYSRLNFRLIKSKQ
ncbi:MAG: hypothetical protein WED33_11175 [Bacteroidia bacterium]